MILQGKTYISSKRAAELCGYAQDYIGQLARGGLIDAQRIGGLWYVLLESLQKYKTNAESYRPEPPRYKPDPNLESTVTLEGKEYVSASLAAKLTQYNQDYVGQLARSGKVISHQVGNRWYVDRAALVAHKNEKDALLAAVLAESVGLKRPTPSNASKMNPEREVLLTYSRDEKNLMPVISGIRRETLDYIDAPFMGTEINAIPIRVIDEAGYDTESKKYYTMSSSLDPVSISEKSMFTGKLALTVFTVVIVLAIGLVSFKTNLIYAVFNSMSGTSTAAASASAVTERIGVILERLLTRELIYERS